MKNKKGFTLIELLIVVAIIGIIAAIAIPNLLRALQKGKQTRTMGDMKSIATAVEVYYTEIGSYYVGDGTVAGTIYTGTTANNAFRTLSKDRTIPTDGWGNAFEYRADTTGTTYSIGSGGRDGSNPGFGQTGSYLVLGMGDFDNDIIYANGGYVYGPRTQ